VAAECNGDVIRGIPSQPIAGEEPLDRRAIHSDVVGEDGDAAIRLGREPVQRAPRRLGGEVARHQMSPV